MSQIQCTCIRKPRDENRIIEVSRQIIVTQEILNFLTQLEDATSKRLHNLTSGKPTHLGVVAKVNTYTSVWSANVFTKDLEEVIIESSSANEVHRCDDDIDHITEFFTKCLDRKGVAMEHTACHNDVGALRFRQCNETGSL